MQVDCYQFVINWCSLKTEQFCLILNILLIYKSDSHLAGLVFIGYYCVSVVQSHFFCIDSLFFLLDQYYDETGVCSPFQKPAKKSNRICVQLRPLLKYAQGSVGSG